MKKTGPVLLITGTLLFIFLAASSYLAAIRLLGEPEREMRLINRISLLERIRDPLNNSIIAVRAYLLTGDESYLAPYYRALPVVQANFREIREYIRRPDLQARLNRLESLVQERFGLLEEAIALRMEGVFGSRRGEYVERGAALDGEINRTIDAWVSEDIGLSRRIGLEFEASLRRLITTAFLGALLSLIILFLTLLLIRARNRTALAQQKAAQEAKLSEELAKTQKFFLHILDSLPGPVMYLDGDSVIRHCNNACSEPLGRPVADIVGRQIYDILTGNREVTDAYDRAMVKGVFSRQIIGFVPPGGGGKRFYDVSFTYDKDASGAVIGVLAEGTDVTELVNMQKDLDKRVEDRTRELRESWTLLTSIIDNSPAVIYFKDTEGRYLLINREFEKLFDTTRQEMQGKTDYDLLTQETASALRKNDLAVIATGSVQKYEETAVVEGATRTYLSIKFPLRKDGKVTGLAGISTDITERIEAEEKLKDRESTLRGITSTALDAIILIDNDGLVTFWNDSATKIFGYTQEEMMGRYLHSLVMPERHIESFRSGFRTFRETGEGKFIGKAYEIEGKRKDGTEFPVELSLAALKLKGRWNAIGIVRDITARKRMEDEIRHMAHHDALTGLPNRRLLMDIVKVEMAQSRRHRKKLAFLYLDLDRFKEINDTLGHETGDRLLKQVGERLRETIRVSDTVARIGGDEFNIVLADAGRAVDVGDAAAKIISCFRSPFTIGGHRLNVTTSIGISIYPDDSGNAEMLQKYADMAMYRAKEKGRNTYQFYDSAINLRSVERTELGHVLRQSIDRNELLIHYQPQIDIRSREAVRGEALVRWRHPERGLLAPDQFLPIAEETGFITEIDDWTLMTVCRQMRQWREAALRPVRITVNLSSRRFRRPDLAYGVAEATREAGIATELLDIEITEKTAMDDIENTEERLRELYAIGVRVSLDDFGRGYSSLNYLKRLPIAQLKISRSLVRDIPMGADDRLVVRAATVMAHAMEKRVAATGVETEEQLKFLQESGCDEMQGNLFSEPLPADLFQKLITAAK